MGPATRGGGDGRKSITWLEVEAAKAAGKDVLAFVVDPVAPWPGTKESDRLDPSKGAEHAIAVFETVKALAEFRKWLEAGSVRDTFSSPDDLAAKVATALAFLAPGGETGGVPTAYLGDIIRENGRILIQGIGSREGESRAALHYAIEDLYTPLSTASRGEAFATRVVLTTALSTRRHILFIGDPGSGKTTFLRLIATVLAKDLLGGEPGRGRHLGLPLDEEPPLPILVPLASIKGRRGRSGCSQDVLDVLSVAYGCEVAALARKRLDDGRAFLLLDGLDEVPGDASRQHIVRVVDAVLDEWGSNRIAITSRPFGFEAVAGLRDLEIAHIDDFGVGEMRSFLRRWVNALFPEGDARSRDIYLPMLEAAIVDVPAIRRLAANPVMLTCLCVVHWNERHLPGGKAALLASVLRWLLNAREIIASSFPRFAVGDILDLHAFRRRKVLSLEDPAFDRHMERGEKALGPAATVAWERFSAVAAGILDAQSGADSLDEAVRRFRKVDAAVALLAFARMIASADADDQEDLRTRFLEAYVIGHHSQIE